MKVTLVFLRHYMIAKDSDEGAVEQRQVPIQGHEALVFFFMRSKLTCTQMNANQCRAKAMRIAAVADGVTSVEIQGADKDELVVIGERVDSVCLTNLLRKKIGYATIVKVEEVKAKEEPKKEEKVDPPPIPPCYYTGPSIVYCEPNQSGCSIM